MDTQMSRGYNHTDGYAAGVRKVTSGKADSDDTARVPCTRQYSCGAAIPTTISMPIHVSIHAHTGLALTTDRPAGPAETDIANIRAHTRYAEHICSHTTTDSTSNRHATNTTTPTGEGRNDSSDDVSLQDNCT